MFRIAVGLIAALGLVLSPARTQAGCNIIPGTSTTFGATLGTTDRPFARPGDFVALGLTPACDGTSPRVRGDRCR